MGLRGWWPYIFLHFHGKAPLTGDTYGINVWINHWLWRWSISLHRGPFWGAWGGVHLQGTLRERWIIRGSVHQELWEILIVEGGLWKWSISLYGLSVKEPGVGGGLLYWGPWKLCRGRLWWWASLSLGALLENLEGGIFTRDFERWLKGAVEVECLSLRQLCERNLEGGSFTGYPGDV
jgi:hypothetical protein